MNFISPNNMMASMASLWIWALVTSMLILVAYLIGTWNHDYFTRRNTPCLKTLPFLGNLGPLIFKEMSVPEYMQDIYNRLRGYKYGGVFEYMKPVLFLRNPKLIKFVTEQDFEHFVDHHSQFTETLIGKSLFNLQGQKWKEMRSTLSSVFTSSNMKDMFVIVMEYGVRLGDFLKQRIKDKNMKIEECKIEKEGNMLVVEMEDLFTRFANDVIATTAFGIECNSFKNPNNEFYEMTKEIINLSRQFVPLGYIKCPRLIKILRTKLISDRVTNFFKSLVKKTIAIHESKDIIRPDMIHLLIQAKKGSLKNGENVGTNGNIIKPKWDEDDLAAQVVLFLFSGFETVSTLLCFVSHELAVYPDIQTRLQEEIDQHLKENGDQLTYEVVHRMKYLDMVVSETLRLYPPTVFTDRRCVKKYTFPIKPSYTLNPGDGIWIPLCAIQRDPRYFPDPDKFDPERFNDENKGKIKPFTYMPFGSGPRNCIGSKFALMETKTVLIYLLSQFNLKVISKTHIPIQIKKATNMTVDGGFWLGLEQRIITESAM